jgi:hypothetical protein
MTGVLLVVWQAGAFNSLPKSREYLAMFSHFLLNYVTQSQQVGEKCSKHKMCDSFFSSASVSNVSRFVKYLQTIHAGRNAPGYVNDACTIFVRVQRKLYKSPTDFSKTPQRKVSLKLFQLFWVIYIYKAKVKFSCYRLSRPLGIR